MNVILVIRVQFGEALLQCAEREQRDAFDVGDLVFVGFADVDDFDADLWVLDGTFHLLNGNLGRAISKISAVKPEHQRITAPAMIFHSLDDVETAYSNGFLNKDVVIVLRFQGPTGPGDSPYQCYSAFAGNPNLVSPDLLIRDALLRPDDLHSPNFPPGPVDYAAAIPYNS